MTKITVLTLVVTVSLAANAYAQAPGGTCRTVPQLELSSMTGPTDHHWIQSGSSLVVNRPTTANVLALDGGACTERAPAAEVEPRESANPLVEFGLGFNGPQYWTAEFPGIALSVAANAVRRRNWGAAIVVEGDASYVRVSRGVGARVFVRSPGLESGKFGATAFAQWLAGSVDAGRSGIIVSNGGRLSQPGIGLTIGTSRRSLLVQVDKQHVSGGFIHDEMRGDTAPMSRTRVTIGYVRRFLSRPR